MPEAVEIQVTVDQSQLAAAEARVAALENRLSRVGQIGQGTTVAGPAAAVSPADIVLANQISNAIADIKSRPTVTKSSELSQRQIQKIGELQQTLYARAFQVGSAASAGNLNSADAALNQQKDVALSLNQINAILGNEVRGYQTPQPKSFTIATQSPRTITGLVNQGFFGSQYSASIQVRDFPATNKFKAQASWTETAGNIASTNISGNYGKLVRGLTYLHLAKVIAGGWRQEMEANPNASSVSPEVLQNTALSAFGELYGQVGSVLADKFFLTGANVYAGLRSAISNDRQATEFRKWVAQAGVDVRQHLNEVKNSKQIVAAAKANLFAFEDMSAAWNELLTKANRAKEDMVNREVDSFKNRIQGAGLNFTDNQIDASVRSDIEYRINEKIADQFERSRPRPTLRNPAVSGAMN